MMPLSVDKQADFIDAFNTTSRYLDGILNINNVYVDNTVSQIYPSELQINTTNTSYNKGTFLDIVGVCNCSMFCCMVLYVHSSIGIILMGKRSWLLCLICLHGVRWWCGAMGLSAVCDCGIFSSYSLTVFFLF